MSDDRHLWEGFLRTQRWREAIASVSLSHSESCTCKICRAVRGDENAMAQVIAELDDGR